MVRVLQVNDSALTGGAATLMGRLHLGLRSRGHSSTILADKAAGGEEGVSPMPPQSLPSRVGFHLLNLLGLNYAGILGTAGRLARHPFFREAEVVHLHNIHGAYFNYLSLPRLSRLRPLVWTLHDMWALTGHCAHAVECDRWRRGCGRCPNLRTYPPARVDSTRLDQRLKRRAYAATAVHVVCPSRWLRDLAREGILGAHPVHHIPNGLDTDVFRPLDRKECRRKLDLPPDAKVVLFSANILTDPFKDLPLLVEALRGLAQAEREGVLLLLIGDGKGIRLDAKMPVRFTGYVRSEAAMAELYGAADLLAHPTRADNQPLVVQEAMACGLPVVSTAVGGVPEMVVPGETGLLAAPGDAGAFRQALASVLSDGSLRRALGERCRRRALEEYGLEVFCRRMLEVYRTAVAGWKGGGRGE